MPAARRADAVPTLPPDLVAEFERHGIEPKEHVFLAEAGDGAPVGF
jgi:hypothetical protein